MAHPMTNPHRRDGDGRPHSVPRAAVDAFSRDGVVRLEGAFGVEWVDTLAAGVERNLRAPGPMATDYIEDGEEGRFFGDYCNWTRIPEFRSFVLESPAAEIAAGVTGSSSVQFYHEHVLIKEPGTSRRTPWHHDLPYFNVEGTKTLAIWLALDPVERSVCPEFVAGSHRWGRLFYPRMFGDFSDYDYEGRGYETVPDIDGRRADYRILAWDLEPGDALLFSFLTLHAAPANRSRRRRRAFVSRWLGDDVRFCRRPGTTSPPYPDIGLAPGDPMREDWFPVVWPSRARAQRDDDRGPE